MHNFGVWMAVVVTAFLLGAVLATYYHTRVEPVASVLNGALRQAKKEIEWSRQEALKAGAQVEYLRSKLREAGARVKL